MGAQSEMPGIRQRGKTFYLYFRVPAQYREVEPISVIDRSLRTACPKEARDRAIVRRSLERCWDERLDQRDRMSSLDGVETRSPTHAREMHQAALALLDGWRIPYRPIDEVAASPLDDLLDRLRKVGEVDLSSNAVPALLGTLDLPATPISRMPQEFERISDRILTAKSPRQLQEWRNKYLRAAQIFVELRGDKAMTRITDEDAMAVRRHWIKRRDADGVSTAYADKQLAYLRQMVDGFYDDLDVPPDRRTNPFIGVKLPAAKHVPQDKEKSRPTLPETWIHTVLYDADRIAGLNDQARDIAWISAETGARHSEIYNAPPADFRLDHEIPHMVVRSVTDGPERREIKNQASERTIVLMGRALEAARRHPEGFPRYRGNGNFSGTVNKYFRDGELFPLAPDGGRQFTLGGLRHAFEARMKVAGLDNEERAFMMGHSIEAIRGRPVYGAELTLSLRSLYQEMVSFPTASWTPRSAEELWELIYRSLEIEGYRSRDDVRRRLSR